MTITIGENAGGGFRGRADLVVARHATRVVGGKEEHGFLVSRKWLADRKAFEYDPRLGWAVEHWFEWPSDVKEQA